MVASRSGTGAGRLIRCVVLPALLAVGLLVGLFTLHGAVLNGGGAAEDAAPVGHVAIEQHAEPEGLGHAADASLPVHAVTETGTHAAHTGTIPTGTVVHSASTGTHASGTEPMGCAHCGGDAALAMMCALTILVSVGAFVHPHRGVLAARVRPTASVRVRDALLAPLPPPSLHALCVSRT